MMQASAAAMAVVAASADDRELKPVVGNARAARFVGAPKREPVRVPNAGIDLIMAIVPPVMNVTGLRGHLSRYAVQRCLPDTAR